MYKVFTLLLLLVTIVTHAQKQPQVYRAYLDKEDRFIINNLILSTDGVFFQFSSCECGKEYYARGTYQIKGDKLYLHGFDSTQAFPRSKIEYIKGEAVGDSVTITTSDYFGNPMTNLLLGLLEKDSSIYPFYEFVDNQGQFKLKRKDYSGFFLIYEEQDGSGIVDKSTHHYFIGNGIKEVRIHIDFATAGFDRQPIPFSFGKQVFKMKDGKLYGKGNKPVYITNPYR
jgi:hypothetical protein